MSDPEDGAGRESIRWRTSSRTSPQTFFADGLAGLEAGARASLASDEVGHIRAARIRRGGRLVVIDGAGSRWEAELAALDRRRASCRLLAPLPPEPALPLHLWAPVANRDRSLWLVEKVVELGAATITWIEWERSRSVADAGRSDGFLRRAEGRARAALKQSGRGWLPRLEGPLTPAEAFGRYGRQEGAGWLADAVGRPLRGGAVARGSEGRPAGRPLTVAVGPEGGLTSSERRRCSEAGFESVSLSRATLRFETAAVVAVASAAAMLADDENEADDEGMT
ncbi:RsmE family RNA methyltransferase [Candidatus Palauibacter sp.]|uniref:RsmE family RNA methyltransferase n=1 Tax=Candidatus Palauibacter sp. TaxID=3101350 RepID=UPI003B01E6A1